MADITPSKNKNASGRKFRKHIARPGTVEEISRAVGVTEEDRRLVHKVLTELGYIGKSSKTSQGRGSSAARKGSTASKKSRS